MIVFAGTPERLGHDDEAVDADHAAARDLLEAAGAPVGRDDDALGADLSARRLHDRAVSERRRAGVFSWIAAPWRAAARARPSEKR